jgi:hydrogenase maturation protein HypF
VGLGRDLGSILACGAQLKSSFCLTRGDHAFLSQHVGDLENLETLDFFVASIEHFRWVFHLDVAAVAHDMHPDYLSTRYAIDLAGRTGVSRVPVQHHHAHLAACMIENGVSEQVIGVAFDGTGHGDDGHLWGGEFLVGDLSGYRRTAHLKYLPLPGGEAAIRRPCRMAASYLVDCFGPEVLEGDLPPLGAMEGSELQLLRRQMERRVNSPLTSSVGRLFDAVSSLIGVRQAVNYEGQAAIELEMAADPEVQDRYDWSLVAGDPGQIEMAPVVAGVVEDLRARVPQCVISAKFHNTIADMIAATCGWIRRETGVGSVALSGGVFQNLFLLERACCLLEAAGFRVLVHHLVPANDGGISLGQAAVASTVLRAGH